MTRSLSARQRFWMATTAALLGVLAAVLLARWQWGRGQAREAVQAAIEAQSNRPALRNRDLAEALGPAGAEQLASLIHRQATLEGTWDAGKTVYLDNRSMLGKPGFYVLTPLRLEGVKPAILVQRGWVPRDIANPARVPAVVTPEGRVAVPGRLAGPPARLLELADARKQPPAGPIRQNLALDAFAAETGVALLPLTLLQTRPESGGSGLASDGLQRDWPVVSSGAAKNFAYAFQWLAIGAVIAGFYFWFFVRRQNSSAPSTGRGL